MNQEQAKKAREQEHLDRFLALQGISPQTKKPGDPLDFVLDLGGGRRVGVELVGVDDQAQSRNNAMADRHIGPKVEAALREKGYVIRVQLIWKFGLNRFAKDPKRIRVFIDNLLAVIDKEAPSLGDEDFVLRDDEEDQRLHDLDLAELSTLALQKVDYLTEPEVLSMPTAWGQGESQVVAVLRKKEAELPEYRKILGPGEVWLLIVTGARFEQNVFAPLVKERNMQSLFDRVFLLDLRAETVVTLK